MRVLLVYCHPNPDSFTAAVRDVVTARLAAAGAEIRVVDVYADRFDPILDRAELAIYEDTARNTLAVSDHVAALKWCDTLVFVYPTWWYGLPARLKGWLDRVLVPGLAFLMPDGPNRTIRPGLTHITGLAVFTTCGASWWLTRFVGAPGRRTLLRGVRLVCAPRCRTAFAAHYLMDSSTPDSRARHLARVAAKVDRFARGRGRTAGKAQTA